MSNIEANNTTNSIGKHNNARDCERRIRADHACKQWRYDQKPAADYRGEWRECCLPGIAFGQTRVEHKQQHAGCNNHKYYVQHTVASVYSI